jgi:peptidoglycan/LPS O-acetylase OafA/YrhL
MTLIPDGNPALSVAWTLTFELCFYLLFSISFYSRELWNYFILFWTILILTFNYTSFANFSINTNPIFRVLKSTYNIEFILGYLLSLLIIYQIKISTKTIIFGLIFLVFFIRVNSISIEHNDFYLNYLFSGITFFVLYLVINNFNKKINRSTVMMVIGNASYSIYLIHNPLQMLILRMYPKIYSVANVILSLVVVLSLSSLFGYVYYLIFEKKCMSFIKSKII